MVVGADFRMVSLVVRVLRLDLREGMFSRRVSIWTSIAASCSGVALSAGSWVMSGYIPSINLTRGVGNRKQT